jgi:hypothetical protein
MLDRFGINLTQLVGLLSFAGASIACFLAAHRSQSRSALTWSLLALVNAFFSIETIVGWRHSIHNFAIAILLSHSLYERRSGFQLDIIVLLAILALLSMGSYVFWQRTVGKAARIAGSITIAVLALFAIETVSLHAVDAFIYMPVGPVVLIGWLWAVAAFAICVAARRR